MKSFWIPLLALLALKYAAINHQGAQDWADAQQELKTKGESLEWSSFIPPPVSRAPEPGSLPTPP